MSPKVTKAPNRPATEPRKVTTTYHSNSADPSLSINRNVPLKRSREPVRMICTDSAEGILKLKK